MLVGSTSSPPPRTAPSTPIATREETVEPADVVGKETPSLPSTWMLNPRDALEEFAQKYYGKYPSEASSQISVNPSYSSIEYPLRMLHYQLFVWVIQGRMLKSLL